MQSLIRCPSVKFYEVSEIFAVTTHPHTRYKFFEDRIVNFKTDTIPSTTQPPNHTSNRNTYNFFITIIVRRWCIVTC